MLPSEAVSPAIVKTLVAGRPATHCPAVYYPLEERILTVLVALLYLVNSVKQPKRQKQQ